MKNIIILVLITFIFSCQKDPVIPASFYECNLAFVDNSESHSKKAQFENAMDKVLETVPGVQIAVRSKDGNLWLGAQGFADIPNNAPFEKCTKTMVGSVSKTYTAVLIMQLVDEGILSIDDPIKDWLDASLVSRIENADVITIKQLLGHRSGIRDYLSAEHHVNSVNIANYKLTVLEKLEYIFDTKAEFAPDEKYSYSNTNYVLLGMIIEKARNMTLDSVVAEYISEPLGFINTVMGTSDNPIPDGTARPYLASSSNRNYIDVMQFSVADAATGDGGLAVNMQEAVLFIEAVFDHLLVSESSLELMKNQRTKEDSSDLLGEDIWYGLGLEQVQNRHGLAIGHTGSTSAYSAVLFHFLDSGVTIAIAYNGDTENNAASKKMEQLILDVIDIAFQ